MPVIGSLVHNIDPVLNRGLMLTEFSLLNLSMSSLKLCLCHTTDILTFLNV